MIVKKVCHDNVKAVKALYLSAFPGKERAPFWLLRLRARGKGVEFFAFYDGTLLCGMAFVVTVEATGMLAYLAVDEALRSKGYGSRILAELNRRFEGKTLMLEVEALDAAAPNAMQREKRRAFYTRNGYTGSGYGAQLFGESFEILWNGCGIFRIEDYHRLIRRLNWGLLQFDTFALPDGGAPEQAQT